MKSSALLRILNRDGWVTKRQKGSHLIMTHPTKQGVLVVPDQGLPKLVRALKTAF